MIKRIVIALSFLAACSPAPQSKTETPAPPAQNADALAAAPAEGQWFFNGDEGVLSANFGPPESEGILSIVCNQPTGSIALHYGGELTPDQDTTLTLITSTQSLDLPARRHNHGLPGISAEISDVGRKAALLTALTAPQQRFAIRAAGDTVVLPWDQSITRALDACR